MLTLLFVSMCALVYLTVCAKSFNLVSLRAFIREKNKHLLITYLLPPLTSLISEGAFSRVSIGPGERRSPVPGSDWLSAAE